jgi:hypothetical protein
MTPQQAKFYKVLGANGEATNGGTGKWFLPHGNRPGKWMPKIKGELIPCKNGYHLCRRQDVIDWLGPSLWEAEYRGECVPAEDKVVVRQSRLIRRVSTWNDKTARLFACDCAEYALGLVKKPDPRSVEAVRVARLFALGEATGDELAAAWTARTASTWDAAWNAAWNAARDAARDAAKDAEAAYTAARAAARTAAFAAWDAAWDAANAAKDAVTLDAWAAYAAWAWMTERLFQYLDGET